MQQRKVSPREDFIRHLQHPTLNKSSGNMKLLTGSAVIQRKPGPCLSDEKTGPPVSPTQGCCCLQSIGTESTREEWVQYNRPSSSTKAAHRAFAAGTQSFKESYSEQLPLKSRKKRSLGHLENENVWDEQTRDGGENVHPQSSCKVCCREGEREFMSKRSQIQGCLETSRACLQISKKNRMWILKYQLQ